MIKKILKLLSMFMIVCQFMSCAIDHQKTVSDQPLHTMPSFFAMPIKNSMVGGEDQVYYIPKDSIYITSNDMPSVLVQAKYLKEHPLSIVLLAGNTNTNGSLAYNFALGWQYAQALANILLAQGVLPNQINVVSYEQENPIDLWHNKEAGSLNRRVILHYYENS